MRAIRLGYKGFWIRIDARPIATNHLPQVLGQLISNPLGANEDENFSRFRRDLLKSLDELAPFLVVRADFDNLSTDS